ncbi:MAG: RMD1 family protein [Bdellovibrionales bacterium]
MNTVKISAQHLSSRLRLKNIASGMNETALSESAIELVYKLGADSYVFIFHFGSLVFINVNEELMQSYINRIQVICGEYNTTTIEDFIIEEDPNIAAGAFHDTGFNKVKIRKLTYPILRLVTLVIAESAALDYFESITEILLSKSRRISANLKQTGRTAMNMKSMVMFVGECLTTKQDIITDLYVVDAPDETWDNQEYDRLYADIKKMFEIETRYRVLEFKLKLVQETVEVIVDFLRFRRQTVMEMIIIGLIAVEVAWLIFQLLTQGPLH